MNAKQVNFPLKQLTNIRMTCVQCKAAIELPLNHLEKASGLSNACPACGAAWIATGAKPGAEVFKDFAEAVRALTAHEKESEIGKRLEIGLVFPDPDSE